MRTPPRILMTTEGTYPYVSGGVSTCCAQLIAGVPDAAWQILPITASGQGGGTPRYPVPPQARLLDSVELWSSQPPPRPPAGPREGARPSLPAELVAALMSWEGDGPALDDVVLYCRRSPGQLRASFRHPRAWKGLLAALVDVLDERAPGVGTTPDVDLHHASQLFHALYWVARVAAVPTPPTDLLLVTAAGWAAVPALAHRALHGTPMVLIEHGVYVKEAYLATLRIDGSPAARFLNTRLARGLARAAYRGADLVSPVSEANATWEEALGVPRSRIALIRNAVDVPKDPVPLPGCATVVNIGRIDPLKDLHTLLRVAAEVVRHVPHALFLQYGSAPPGQDAYAASCFELHAQLGLRDRFRFMGHTSDPQKALRGADIVIMTSITEGLPMSLLEGMAQARPVVSTWVGGVPEAARGCGVLCPPGDVHELAMGVVTLLKDPFLAKVLGNRGHQRVAARFAETNWLRQSRALLFGLAATGTTA